MKTIKNPAGLSGSRQVQKIVATAKPRDLLNTTENLTNFQSQSLAIRSVLKRFPVSAAHAKVICELSGLGGRA